MSTALINIAQAGFSSDRGWCSTLPSLEGSKLPLGASLIQGLGQKGLLKKGPFWSGLFFVSSQRSLKETSWPFFFVCYCFLFSCFPSNRDLALFIFLRGETKSSRQTQRRLVLIYFFDS